MIFHFFENLAVSFSSKGLPACHTKVIREKVGMPWNKRVAIHPLPDGHVEVTPILEGSPQKLIES